MIYVWLKHIEVMYKFRSRQEYWESYTYENIIKNGSGGFEVMCEHNTPYWKE